MLTAMALFDAVFIPTVRLTYQPLGQTIAVKLAPGEVQGFAAGAEPTQADADVVAARLAELDSSLTAAQQTVLRSLVEQAAA